MATVGVMSFLHNENYGSVLQAWALQQALQALGCTAEHIDYRPSGAEKLRNLLGSGNSPALLLDGLRKRRVMAVEAGARARSQGFAAFRAERLRLSPPAADHRALASLSGRYEILLSGSDQVWSPEWLNPAYFFDFAPEGKPCVSYAPSLGVSEWPNERKKRRIQGLLQRFQAVSVREEEGAKLLRPLCAQPVSVQPDPVFLLERAQWQQLAEKRPAGKPYLLCYFIGEQAAYWAQAARLAEEQGLRLLVIPVTKESYQKESSQTELATGLRPEAWLGCLSGAAWVCTDSFHGAALAAVLGVPVTVLRRYSDGSRTSKNSRIDQLLRQLNAGADTILPSPGTDERLTALRQQGLSWLGCALSQAGGKAPPAAGN